MESKKWIENYNKLNNSFQKTLVFRVGIQAGLYSEINHMFLAILFCLKNNIKFVLSSRDNNFSYDKGWEDYFLPFCEESYSKVHLKYNARSYQIKPTIPNIIKTKIIRKTLGIDYLTQDIWTFIRDAKFQNETFDIPQLGISGNLVSALQMVVNNVWNFQPDIQQEINGRIQGLNLPTEYVGVHLRSGDKVTEAKVSSAHEYINYIKNITPLKNLFVFTDDYKNISELKSSFTDYRIYTFCKEGEKGFSEGAYNRLNKEAKKEMTIKVLTDSEALYKSSVFVGTMSSNVGLFIGMQRNAKLWYGIDANDWRMW
ncbi:O-fucosyltransferase family protein [Mucilaginibacter arboris]|uniref:Alpha-(1,6)-fucosyltransferase N- and catalytic domain-containing protein n=1 Tax=Mucilaginibacter arboris TaxID=2682090 RepID=A0A7K1SY36_9SPHI|nr:hypothetical protein [Mucilaginibacter arboris]MVN22235.1 hypothetical protein [Mucilaginibacter arboris]